MRKGLAVHSVKSPHTKSRMTSRWMGFSATIAVANLRPIHCNRIIAGSRPIGMAIGAYGATALRADLRLLLQPSAY